MEPIPTYMRERIVEAVHQGASVADAAERFAVSETTVRNYLKLSKQGDLEPKPRSGGPEPELDEDDLERLRAAVEARPDATLQEYRDECGFEVDVSTVCRALAKLGLNRKRKVPKASERDEERIRRLRADWRERTANVDAQRLVFVDEMGISTRMTRFYGRAPAGVPVPTNVPNRNYQSLTTPGGLRLGDADPPTLTYPGGTTAERMLEFIAGPLGERLRRGDIVVADNLAAHKSRKVAEALAAREVELWLLPPYSPDLNPIERLWSKVKTFLRSAKATAVAPLRRSLRRALESVTNADVRHWIEHSDYLVTA